MRGRPLVAVLVAAVAGFAAFGLPVALAQTRSADPQAGANTETAAENPPDLLSGEQPDYVPKAPDQPAPAPEEVVAPTPDATPVVASIRAKLADLRKTSSSAELVALEEFYNGRGQALWMTDMGFSGEALAAIDEMLRADDWGLSSAAFDLPPAGDLPKSPDDAAANEIKLDLAILKYARYARGGRTDPAKLNKLFGVAPTLRDPKTVLAEIASAEAPDAYLRSLHPKHEQFQRLHQALLKARAESDAGAKANTQKIVVNMERWRWMPEDLGSLHLWLNVPAFTVYVFKDGKSIYSDKIVVGELKYATPMFSADLKSVVFNPEWTVPPTIVRENLLPNLRGGGGWFGGGNTAILDQHELKVKYNGSVVDPGSIDWNNVNMGAISFVQAPGPNNVLGKVKFVYPNPYTVYMHDTIKQGCSTRTCAPKGTIARASSSPARSPPSCLPPTRTCRRPRSISCSPMATTARSTSSTISRCTRPTSPPRWTTRARSRPTPTSTSSTAWSPRRSSARKREPMPSPTTRRPRRSRRSPTAWPTRPAEPRVSRKPIRAFRSIIVGWPPFFC